jgi:hypothetical protein
MAKEAVNKKMALFTNEMDLNIRKELRRCYFWSLAFYGTETSIIWRVRNTWKVWKCGDGGGWRR